MLKKSCSQWLIAGRKGQTARAWADSEGQGPLLLRPGACAHVREIQEAARSLEPNSQHRASSLYIHFGEVVGGVGVRELRTFNMQQKITFV